MILNVRPQKGGALAVADEHMQRQRHVSAVASTSLGSL